MLYNPKRRHCFNIQPSPVDMERRYAGRVDSVLKIVSTLAAIFAIAVLALMR